MEAWNFRKNSMDFDISKVLMSHRHIWLSFRLKNLLRFKVNIFNGIYVFIERESIVAHVKTNFFRNDVHAYINWAWPRERDLNLLVPVNR